MICSNRERPIELSGSDRRYAVFDHSDKYVKTRNAEAEEDFWKPLYAAYDAAERISIRQSRSVVGTRLNAGRLRPATQIEAHLVVVRRDIVEAVRDIRFNQLDPRHALVLFGQLDAKVHAVAGDTVLTANEDVIMGQVARERQSRKHFRRFAKRRCILA